MLRIGVLTPHAASGPEEELPAMAPGRVTATVVRVAKDPPTTPAALRALTEPRELDEAARLLVGSVDVVGYASTTSAYALGFEEEAQLVSRLSSLLGAPVASTCESAVLGLRALGIRRVSLVGAPWFEPELNDLGTAYFRSAGFDVISSESAALPQEPDRVEPADVVAWTSRHVPEDAEAVFIGGNGFRAAAAVEPLETAIGRPVLTSNQVLLWGLLARAGRPFGVDGFGRLFSANA